MWSSQKITQTELLIIPVLKFSQRKRGPLVLTKAATHHPHHLAKIIFPLLRPSALKPPLPKFPAIGTPFPGRTARRRPQKKNVESKRITHKIVLNRILRGIYKSPAKGGMWGFWGRRGQQMNLKRLREEKRRKQWSVLIYFRTKLKLLRLSLRHIMSRATMMMILGQKPKLVQNLGKNVPEK